MENKIKDVSLYQDTKKNNFWLFPNGKTKDGLYMMLLPFRKFPVATTDYKSLMTEIFDMMQYCKMVDYKEASEEIKTRFKKETGWYSPLALQKSSSAVLSISMGTNIIFTIYETDRKKMGLYKSDIKCPLDASIDELARALEEALEKS